MQAALDSLKAEHGALQNEYNDLKNTNAVLMEESVDANDRYTSLIDEFDGTQQSCLQAEERNEQLMEVVRDLNADVAQLKAFIHQSSDSSEKRPRLSSAAPGGIFHHTLPPVTDTSAEINDEVVVKCNG